MEQKIISQFLYNHKLKFNEIEKLSKIRSNKLSYHIKKLKEKGILVMENDFYKLSETAENLIPYLSKKKNILSIILIHIGNGKNVFLYKREKRPFKNKLSLPGGRIILGETIEDSVKRIMKEKYNIEAKLQKIHSISMEHIKNSKNIIQSDLIIFVTATTNNLIELIDIEKNKSKIISSDYELVKKHLNKKIEIEKFLTLN